MGGAGHPPVLEAAPQVSCRVLPPPHPNQALSLEHLSGSNVPPIPTAVSPNLTSQAAKIAWQLPSQSPHLQPSPCTPGCPVTVGPYEASSQLAPQAKQEDRMQPSHAPQASVGFVVAAAGLPGPYPADA